MKGYEVVTSDEHTIGRVAETLDGFLVVELGRFWKLRRPVPKEFAHAVDDERKIVVTVPKAVLRDAPRVRRDGTFDVDEAARHYGLAGTLAPDAPVFAEQSTEHRRAELRKHATAESGQIEDEGAAPLTKHPEDEVDRRPERVMLPRGQ
ncbi:MAG TPA: hypothetical protein VJT84_05675 [Gaiellaceae bacterium]|nr:hypothetical protein [Gaiellaceae bacterium]